MRIFNAPINYIYPLPSEPQRERDALPQLQPPAQTRTNQTEPVERPVAEIERAEQLWRDKRSTTLQARTPDDQRVKRALDEYQSVQQDREQRYLKEILGIDEYA